MASKNLISLIKANMIDELTKVQTREEIEEFLSRHFEELRLFDRDEGVGLIEALICALLTSNAMNEHRERQINLAERYIRDLQQQVRELRN